MDRVRYLLHDYSKAVPGGLFLVPGYFTRDERNRVPIVWRYGWSVDDVLGDSILVHGDDGNLYADCEFDPERLKRDIFNHDLSITFMMQTYWSVGDEKGVKMQKALTRIMAVNLVPREELPDTPIEAPRSHSDGV